MKYLTPKNIIVFLLIGIVVFCVLIFLGDYRQVAQNIRLIKLEIILLIIGLIVFGYIFRFLRWQYFLNILDMKVSLKNSILTFFSGMSMTITPGKVGEVLKSYLLKQSEGIEIEKSIMIIFTERLTDVLGLGVLCLLGLSSFFMHVYAVVFVFVIIFVMIFMITNEFIFFKISLILEKIPVIKNYVKFMKDIYSSSKKLLSFKSLITSTMLSFVAWSFECLGLYIILKSLGYPLSLLTCMFIFSFSSIFGSVLVLPGGLGVAEGSFMGLLLISNIPKNIAVVATIVIRICTLWFGVSVGLLSLFIFNRRLKS